MHRQSKKNEEFNTFFKEFKEKNKGKWASIINGMDVDDSILRQETETEKAEEMEMLQEFEKRRQFKDSYDAIDKADEEDDVTPEKRLNYKEPTQKNENPDSLEDAVSPDPNKNEIFDST